MMNIQNKKTKNAMVKMIFLHHSCGQNWLKDDNGQLGLALDENNYFVSDTYYGWGPDSIGSRTDIGNWWEWFCGPDRDTYMKAVYTESGQLSRFTRKDTVPEGENEIIMFKSCYPNSMIKPGTGASVPPIDENPLRGMIWRSEHFNVTNAKGIYISLLEYFSSRPDKLFIAVTAPPVMSDEFSSNAREFNTWLTQEWLRAYPGKNVGVFDFYDVMTGGKGDTLIYPTSVEDNHPTAEGNRLATEAFIPFINELYHRFSKAKA